MAESRTLETVPITTDCDGVIRISGTRVPLETVVAVFQEGATAEEIVQDYPSLPLADVYQVIAYYLRHADELKPYFERRHEQAEEVRRMNESRWRPEGIRERLLARWRPD